MDKLEILEAIKRTTTESGGKAPGWRVFERLTGFRKSDWYPYLWLRWGDALTEAGFVANTLQAPINPEILVQKYICLARELKHLPVEGEIRRQGKRDKTFPSHSTFKKFGGKDRLLDEVLRYAKEHPGNEDIVALCEKGRTVPKSSDDPVFSKSKAIIGFVYLMKSGPHYKIGHTNSVGSRERQLAIKIPVPPTTIHSIKTDDPRGVEAYWHKRFESKRGEGEWFDLSSEDVQAFKRWKRIA